MIFDVTAGIHNQIIITLQQWNKLYEARVQMKSPPRLYYYVTPEHSMRKTTMRTSTPNHHSNDGNYFFASTSFQPIVAQGYCKELPNVRVNSNTVIIITRHRSSRTVIGCSFVTYDTYKANSEQTLDATQLHHCWFLDKKKLLLLSFTLYKCFLSATI